ncbi:bile acid:sodium symporter family protein [Croceitalea rosinachiae]|uniref:Bile acid:sodium symporter family protein n=1 Tax=Croceitalea rosinachiae TaxID=3075596 RepID=A0ABU3AD15_9FLAO|nr:bile acid:sodium symporter family protein [Croceitalea sp. F388]MDT0607874.1 bile acid:sodium symporter family protein [Croceitalea sp. F388]
MKKLKKFGWYLIIGLVLVSISLFFCNKIQWLGIALVLLFILLALVLQTSKKLKGFSFTVLIFAAVIGALFYPEVFIQIGSFELKKLIIPLLMIIMFGMGTSMSFLDFVGVVKMPKGVLIGLLLQFTVMPFIGFGLAYVSNLPPEIAAGVILVGCSPSGLASNVMAYISGANLALSLTLTAVATLLAPLVTPFFMKLLANELVPIDFITMFWSIVKIVILPIVLGLLLNHFAKTRITFLNKILPLVSMAGIASIIVIITAAGRDSLLSIGLILILVVIAHNLCGFLLGYFGGRLCGLDVASSRTIAFEVGMQNAGLASGIALEMGKLATMGLASAVFGPWMNISGSSLASIWKERKP